MVETLNKNFPPATERRPALWDQSMNAGLSIDRLYKWNLNQRFNTFRLLSKLTYVPDCSLSRSVFENQSLIWMIWLDRTKSQFSNWPIERLRSQTGQRITFVVLFLIFFNYLKYFSTINIINEQGKSDLSLKFFFKFNFVNTSYTQIINESSSLGNKTQFRMDDNQFWMMAADWKFTFVNDMIGQKANSPGYTNSK